MVELNEVSNTTNLTRPKYNSSCTCYNLKKMVNNYYFKKLKLLDERIFLFVISNGFRHNVKYT